MGADTIKQVEMKDKIQKEYLRRTRKLLETKLNSRNLIKGINTGAVPLVRYSGPFLKWTRDELRQMDQRARKTNDYAQGVTSQRRRGQTICIKKRGRKRTCQHQRQCWRIHTTMRRLHRKTGLITAIRNNTDNTINNRMTKTRKQKWEENQLHGHFQRLINDI